MLIDPGLIVNHRYCLRGPYDTRFQMCIAIVILAIMFPDTRLDKLSEQFDYIVLN